jgi:hypothetical protein
MSESGSGHVWVFPNKVCKRKRSWYKIRIEAECVSIKSYEAKLYINGNKDPAVTFRHAIMAPARYLQQYHSH